MAEILDDYDFSDHPGMRGKYPYEEWFDGQVWKLIPGEDFNVSTESLRVCIYTAAKRRDLRVRTTISAGDGSLIIQAELSPFPWQR